MKTEALAEVVAFLINCVVCALLSVGMFLFVRWLFDSLALGIVAGVVQAVDGYLLAVFRFSIISGKRPEK